MIPCDRCSLPLEPDDAHWDHQSDCRISHRGHNAVCVCSLMVHPDCCRACVVIPAHTNPRGV